MLKLAAALLILPLLAAVNTDVKNGQQSPDQRCAEPGAGNCPDLPGEYRLSPYNKLNAITTRSQYHTMKNFWDFSDVGVITVAATGDSDPWNVGRYTLSEKKTVVLPNSYGFGYHKGIELRTLRLSSTLEKNHRLGTDSWDKEYQFELTLVGRNLDQPSETAANSYVAISRLFRMEEDGHPHIDPSINTALTNLINSERVSPLDLDLAALFPGDPDSVIGLQTYEGSSGEACSCETDTTWIILTPDGSPDKKLSQSLLTKMGNEEFNTDAWRDNDNAEETAGLQRYSHSFWMNCDEQFDTYCDSICPCGEGISTVMEIPEDEDGDGEDGDGEDGDGEDGDGEDGDGEDGDGEDGDGEDGDGEDGDDCKKVPTPAHCMSAGSAADICVALTLSATVLFFN